MSGELRKYFTDVMLATEEADSLGKLRSNPGAKKEFTRMKAVWAISGLISQKGDREKATTGIAEFGKRLKQRSIRRPRARLLKCAATICPPVTTTWLASNRYTQIGQKDLYAKISIPRGQRVNITPPDDTSVQLNPQSKIRISSVFSRKSRMVELSDEGYFEVAKNIREPFVVKTQRFNIQILGTRFNVLAYAGKENKLETCLIEDRVLAHSETNRNEKVYLNPYEKVSSADSRMVVSTSNFDSEEYPESSIFSFCSKSFGGILNYLTLWYNVQFKFIGDMKLDKRISNKIRQSGNAGNILIALQGVYHFKPKRTDDGHYKIY